MRLCLDPMIYCKDWRGEYSRLVDDVFSQIDGSKLWDVSIGSFRISQDYLKKMRKDMPCSCLLYTSNCYRSGCVCNTAVCVSYEAEQGI